MRYDSVYLLGTLVGTASNADRIAATLGPVLDLPSDQLRSQIDPTNGKQPVVLRSGVPSAVKSGAVLDGTLLAIV